MIQTNAIEHLRVGVGRADITPPLGTPLTGYPDPDAKRRAETVRDPLYATALVVEQGEHRAALISIDTCVIDDVYVQRIREGVTRETGIPSEHVSVCATHSHSTPRTHTTWGWGEPNEQYATEQMVPGAIEAVRGAAAQAAPARMGIGTCRSEAGVNRRPLNEHHRAMLGQLPWGLTDPQMTVLRFEGADGPIANIVHYGAHPTVFGGDSRAISRDWPAILVDRMEQLTGATTLFVNGAQGDVAPHTGSGRASGDGEVALWETGARAALDALRTWRGIKELRDVALGVHAATFELPYRPLPSREEATAQLKAAEANKDAAGRGICEFMHWSAVLAAHDEPACSGKPYMQSLLALGPVVFVPFPGEPFAELALRLRAASPFQHTLAAAVSCGNNGYLWSQEQLCRGGYEPWVGRAFGARLLVEHIDDVLVDENVALLQKLHAQMNPPLPGA
ncbi:MAG: neutral/alkaline non-lysosomal ceramidase N-terminal domain-containing protein [Phycisphaeraceae bacterium]